jgi:hypothetical protein
VANHWLDTNDMCGLCDAVTARYILRVLMVAERDLKVPLQKSGLKKRIRKYEVDQIDAAKSYWKLCLCR